MIGKFTLDNFYKSSEWFELTRQIKLDRLDENGQLICWHCGKPIVKSYDCICHHTIFLTEENVNNIDISLNEKLIKLVHHVCHNKIHNKLGYTKKEVFLVYGSPMSGKAEWVKDNMNEGDLVVSLDNIWECVSSLNKFRKPPKLNSVVFGVRDYLIDCVKVRRGKWDNAYIIGGYPLISERERLCKELGAREIYIESTKEQCYQRIELSDDLEDKNQWKKFVDDWWNRYAPHCPKI